MIEVRPERASDIAAIRGVHDAAFGQHQEGALVDALRANGGITLSLVAADGDDIVGHIVYSPARIATAAGAALGPMAVHPAHQRHGIGSRLVQAGNRELEESGCSFVIVVGHPEFYPRFGFERASSRKITCEWDVPDAAFMVLVLDRRAMQGVSGLARYRREFAAVS